MDNLDRPLQEILSVRVSNALRRYGMNTLRDVISRINQKHPKELSFGRNFGPTAKSAQEELLAALDKEGYYLFDSWENLPPRYVEFRRKDDRH